MAIASPGRVLSPLGVYGAILVIAAARLFFAATIPLTEDEAYYRLWSMRIQLGYFDHPPMIAWWVAAGRAIFGDNPLGIRLLPILANAVTALLLIDTLRTLGAGEASALRAGLWLNATLLIGAGALLAIPDAPAALFWTTTLWALSKATVSARGVWWWAVAGIAAGLAVWSKYSALFLAPGILLWLCATAANRRWLMRPGPWLAAGAAGVVIAPHIAWNALNGWVSILKQFGRVEPKSFEPEHLLEFVAGQFLLLNPIIAVFALVAVFRPRATLTSPFALLWLSALPFLAYLLAHSLHDSVQAHWSAPIYPAIVGLAATAAGGAWMERRSVHLWRQAAPVLGLALVGLGLTLAAAPALDVVSGPAMRPLRGWPGFAASLQARSRGTSQGHDSVAWIGTASYGLAAQLEAERNLSLPVVQLNDRARYDALPPAGAINFGKAGLVVDLPRRVTAEALRTCFSDVQALEPVHRSIGAEGDRSRVVYAVFRVAHPIRLVSGGCRRGREFATGPAAWSEQAETR